MRFATISSLKQITMINGPPLTLGEARQAAQQRMQQLPQPPRPFMMEEFQRDEEGDENDIISSSLLGTVSVPTALRNRLDLRSGKWTKEEEQFAFTIIQQFQNGTLQVPETSTLRQCLSVALNCDAMRISKKFAGPYSIGKQVFTPLDKANVNYSMLISVAADELNIGRANWFRKLDEIENQTISRSRKKMRLESKGTSSSYVYSDQHTVLRDKTETADLESFQSAVTSLRSLKQEGSSGRPNGAAPRHVQALNDDKLPGVVSAIEKILKGEFSQHHPQHNVPGAPMWAAPSPAFPQYHPPHMQMMQQQMMHMQQQHLQPAAGQPYPQQSNQSDTDTAKL